MIDLEKIANTVGADSVALMVPNMNEGYMFCYQSYNMPDSWTKIRNSLHETEPGLNAQVLASGKPIVANHIDTVVAGHHMESVLVVPIQNAEKTIATLELIKTSGDKGFTDKDVGSALAFVKTTRLQLDGTVPPPQ